MEVSEVTAGHKIYYINLDRVPDRRFFMEDQFRRSGLTEVNRVSATDASREGSLDSAGYVPGSGSRWGLTPSEVGCFESHRRIWQKCVDLNLNAVAAFEDDVELSSEAARVIRKLLSCPEKYDYVKLDYSPRKRRFGAAEEFCGVSVRPIQEMISSAGAYVLSNAGCRKLLTWSREYSDHLDDFITMPRSNWRMFQCFPAVCVQAVLSQLEAVSTIKCSERLLDKSINSGLDKGPFWFRVRRELKAGQRKLYWRAGGEARLLRRGGYVGFVPCSDDLKV
ncbi:glycosyltransferase family 25 protein [Ruegeria arenilitoris]|uniref:glycosyltransferase family 25 protein n=1 Tax=Ruegeria arenilitoris TaxID=1173585 RepID=UPI00147A51C6|nr:glycosyltransferase family 25 protein [Ruegeria arenilitoris]